MKNVKDNASGTVKTDMAKNEDEQRAVIGLAVRNARLSAGLTQIELSGKINATAHYISDIERGRKVPSLPVFIELFHALDLSADQIISKIYKEEIPDISYDNYLIESIEGLPVEKKARILQISRELVRLAR